MEKRYINDDDMTKLILKGEPKSTNHVYATMCRGNFPNRYMTAKGKELKESYQWQAKSQWRESPTPNPVELDVKLYFGTKRKQDIDNYNKILYDALTGIVWVDDSQIKKVLTEKFYDKENPRVELEIIR